jgi:hypothetical protein
MKCAIQVTLDVMLQLPRFMKLGTSFQAILRFRLKSLRVAILITHGRNL